MTRSNYNLAQWLEWMEKNHPTEIDLGLSRVGQVYKNMHLDLSDSKIISIAGTNGKGSTTAILESIYLAASCTTLAYTSPHMLHYNERVRIDGCNVTDNLLIEAFNAIDLAMGAEDTRITLSYFEIGTLAAIYLVAKLKPNVALMEVGLGGRLDAVNIIDADVAVITTLAIDHIDWLGDDIEQIGLEKAGIARSHKPLICGELSPPASIAAFSAEQSIELLQINSAFEYALDSANTWSWRGVDSDGNSLALHSLPIPKLPVQNSATALQVIAKSLIPCSQDAIVKGLQNACALGRLQQVDYLGQQVLLDVAHNPQSAKYLAKSLQQKGLSQKVHLVLGVLADKDCQGLIAALKDVVLQWHLVTLDVYRGQSSKELEKAVIAQGIEEHCITCHPAIESAICTAISNSKTVDQVVVAGSFVTVTSALELIERSD